MTETVDDEFLEYMARADASFAGRDFDGLSAADKKRYLARARFIVEKAVFGRLVGLEELKKNLDSYRGRGSRGHPGKPPDQSEGALMQDDDIPEDVKRGVEKALFGGGNPTRPTVVETRRAKHGSKWPRQKFDTYGFPAGLLKTEKPKE